MKPIYQGINIFILIVVVTSCNENSTSALKTKNKDPRSVVVSPFKSVNLPVETFTISPGEEQQITTSNGSKIKIPKESLIDENGDLIKEPVTISLKNFMDAAEIMTAGIPMKYSDDTTKSTPFQSAGMFEIQASTSSGKKVMINQEKPLSMELATYRSEKGFDNFYLDTLTGKWNKTENENLHLNIDKENLKAQITKLKSKTVFNGNLFVLNFNYLLDEFLNNDYQAIYPFIINAKKKLPNKLLNYGINGEDIWDYEKVSLNKNDVPASLIVWEKTAKIQFPAWTKDHFNYASHKKINGDLYEFTVENRLNKTETFKFMARAKMTIKSLFKVAPEKWSSEYEQTLKEIKEHELSMSKMNDLSRTLQINQFGIYNCDRLYDQPERFLASVEFVVPINKKGFTPDRFFYISKRDKVCIDYTFQKENKLTLCNDPTAELYTVLEGDILATVSTDELSKCSKENTAKQKLIFKPGKKIQKLEDLKTIMGI
jgi:hypothetical protein